MRTVFGRLKRVESETDIPTPIVKTEHMLTLGPVTCHAACS